jgi:hypothetical protein
MLDAGAFPAIAVSKLPYSLSCSTMVRLNPQSLRLIFRKKDKKKS